MPRFWVRRQGTFESNNDNSLAGNLLIYQNSRETTGSITLVQKATVVATHLWAISDSDDTWSCSLLVIQEDRNLSYADPGVDVGDFHTSDPEVKGFYPFARGPMMYSPRRKIAIPVEHALYCRFNKEEGNAESVLHVNVQFLLTTSL